jgi:hypothetical protein
LDTADGRPLADSNVKSDVTVGADVISVVVDVCLFASSGYAARLNLWDARSCSREEARVLLGPCVLALEQEFGSNMVEDAAVFHIRSSSVYAFSRAQALRGLSDVQAALTRAQQ